MNKSLFFNKNTQLHKMSAENSNLVVSFTENKLARKGHVQKLTGTLTLPENCFFTEIESTIDSKKEFTGPLEVGTLYDIKSYNSETEEFTLKDLGFYFEHKDYEGYYCFINLDDKVKIYTKQCFKALITRERYSQVLSSLI